MIAIAKPEYERLNKLRADKWKRIVTTWKISAMSILLRVRQGALNLPMLKSQGIPEQKHRATRERTGVLLFVLPSNTLTSTKHVLTHDLLCR